MGTAIVCGRDDSTYVCSRVMWEACTQADRGSEQQGIAGRELGWRGQRRPSTGASPWVHHFEGELSYTTPASARFPGCVQQYGTTAVPCVFVPARITAVL